MAHLVQHDDVGTFHLIGQELRNGAPSHVILMDPGNQTGQLT